MGGEGRGAGRWILTLGEDVLLQKQSLLDTVGGLGVEDAVQVRHRHEAVLRRGKGEAVAGCCGGSAHERLLLRRLRTNIGPLEIKALHARIHVFSHRYVTVLLSNNDEEREEEKQV